MDDRDSTSDWSDTPRLRLPRGGDPVVEILQRASEALLKHPIATQAAFSALVAEGRRFAQTAEGRRWRAALSDSEFARRGRAMWEATSLNLLEDNPDVLLPTAILDAMVTAMSRDDLEELVRAVNSGRQL